MEYMIKDGRINEDGKFSVALCHKCGGNDHKFKECKDSRQYGICYPGATKYFSDYTFK